MNEATGRLRTPFCFHICYFLLNPDIHTGHKSTLISSHQLALLTVLWRLTLVEYGPETVEHMVPRVVHKTGPFCIIYYKPFRIIMVDSRKYVEKFCLTEEKTLLISSIWLITELSTFPSFSQSESS